MINSYECAILGLYAGIFADVRVNLPTVCGLERDESRLLSAVRTRGLRSLTIDLPAYGKHFDKCLAAGRLTPSGIPNFGFSKRRPGHPFLGGLVNRVFDKNGLLLLQPCHTSIFFIRQLLNGAKKIKMECSEKVRENALSTYIRQEQSLRPPSLDWHGGRDDCRWGERLRIDDVCLGDGTEYPTLDGSGVTAAFCDTVHNVADRLFSSFGHFEPTEWRAKHGPGAVADRAVGSFKYNFPTWSPRLERIFPVADLAYANYGCWVDDVRSGDVPSNEDVPSVVLTVPKSQKTPRIIAKEPIANMWCQQIIRDFLESSVSSSPLRHCISFRDQSFNAEAALKASVTGDHWTIDLSSASDRVSLWLVERLVRSNTTLLAALAASRSTHSRVDLRDESVLLFNKKFAPQGAATTFPLQTIIYSILAISALIHARGWSVSGKTIAKAAKEVRVFGDDTIVPEDCGRQYVAILTYCGFFVNHDKTFTEGNFRESCGCEAFQGTDVTPAYLTYPYNESDPSSVASIVECSNNFYKKGLWHSALALESMLPFWMRKHLRIVGPGDGAFGLTSFVGSRGTKLLRYNHELHRDECLALAISSEDTKVQPGGNGHLLQYFTENPAQDIFWMSGVGGRPVSRVRKRWEPLAA